MSQWFLLAFGALLLATSGCEHNGEVGGAAVSVPSGTSPAPSPVPTATASPTPTPSPKPSASASPAASASPTAAHT